MSKLELEILRYQRLAGLGRDLGGFVHNAAGPLNIIMGYIQVLRMKLPDEKGIGKIWDASLELDKMLKELGTHTEKLETSYSEDINVNKTISRQLDLLRANNYFKHNIEANEDLCDKEPEINAMYGDFVILLDILLNNAIEAVYKSDIKKIFVVTRTIDDETGKWLKIIVRDTGNGVENDNLSHYFEAGYSGWNKEEKKPGMGLTLAKYICERLQGRISLQNSDGIGAEAVIDLPIR